VRRVLIDRTGYFQQLVSKNRAVGTTVSAKGWQQAGGEIRGQEWAREQMIAFFNYCLQRLICHPHHTSHILFIKIPFQAIAVGVDAGQGSQFVEGLSDGG
jgi:hypothetical protein